MKRATNQGQVNQKRIAVWMFWDLILPVQRGGPGTKERRESNKEIEEAFRGSKYYPDLDLAEVYFESGYYVTREFRVEKDKVFFRGSDGKEYSAPKHWAVFEAKYPAMFKMWDSQKVI